MRSKTHQAKHNNIKPPNIGAVLEWLKRHAWKACIRQKRIGGSNPPHSARNTLKDNELKR